MTITQSDLFVNEKIKALKILVIDDEGRKIGVMMTRDALNLAQEKGLDLVEVAPTADPPVTRIMDYGKFIYTQQKRNRDAKKKQAAQQVREIKLRTKTEDHDLQTKLKKAREFLEKGDRVKIRVVYKGREMAHPELGRNMADKVVKELEPLGAPLDKGEMMGRNLIVVITPHPKSQAPKKPKEKGPETPSPPATEEGV